MFAVVLWCEAKVLGVDYNERPVAYYIDFSQHKCVVLDEECFRQLCDKSVDFTSSKNSVLFLDPAHLLVFTKKVFKKYISIWRKVIFCHYNTDRVKQTADNTERRTYFTSGFEKKRVSVFKNWTLI